MNNDYSISIYVTHKNMEEAKKVAKVLLEQKLIACATYFPVTSEYVWEGEIKNEEEVVSLFKTVRENWTLVKERIEAIHPYDVPAIMRYDVVSTDDYLRWMYNTVIVV